MKRQLVLVAAIVASACLAGCAPTPSTEKLITQGSTQYSLGQLDQAQDTFDILLSREPGNPDALFYVGRIHQARGEPLRAMYYYQCCLSYRPGFTPAATALAQVQGQVGAATAEQMRLIPPVHVPPVKVEPSAPTAQADEPAPTPATQPPPTPAPVRQTVLPIQE